MLKLINTKTENFKNNLIRLINEAELPISNIYFVFKLTEKELESYYYQTLNKENQTEIETQIINENVQKKVEENT